MDREIPAYCPKCKSNIIVLDQGENITNLNARVFNVMNRRNLDENQGRDSLPMGPHSEELRISEI